MAEVMAERTVAAVAAAASAGGTFHPFSAAEEVLHLAPATVADHAGKDLGLWRASEAAVASASAPSSEEAEEETTPAAAASRREAKRLATQALTPTIYHLRQLLLASAHALPGNFVLHMARADGEEEGIHALRDGELAVNPSFIMASVDSAMEGVRDAVWRTPETVFAALRR